jgi:hypothetical protein
MGDALWASSVAWHHQTNEQLSILAAVLQVLTAIEFENKTLHSHELADFGFVAGWLAKRNATGYNQP